MEHHRGDDGGVAVRVGWSWTTPALDVFCTGLIVLACTDIDRRLLPRRIVYPTALLSGGFIALGALSGGRWDRLGVAVGASVCCYGAFRIVHICNRRWLGFGDVRLAGVIGLVLGWLGLPDLLAGLIVANVAGIVVATALVVLGRMRRDAAIPYGAFLAGGCLVAVLAGSGLTRLLGAG